MEDFVTVDSVAIFDVHDDYTPDILNEIVANCNKRVADTGDVCPLSHRIKSSDNFSPKHYPAASVEENDQFSATALTSLAIWNSSYSFRRTQQRSVSHFY